MEDGCRCAQCHQDLGDCLLKQGQLTKAEYHYRQAVGLWQSLGRLEPLTPALTRLGTLLGIVGRDQEALELLERSRGLAQQRGDVRAMTAAQVARADLYLGQGDYEAAMQAYRTALERVVTVETESDLETEILIKLAHCFYPSDLEQALKLIHQAEERVTGPQQLAYALHGRICMGYKDYERSYRFFARALGRTTVKLEEIKIRLWWGYSLLLDLRAVAAFEQVQQAMRALLRTEALLPAVRALVPEIKPLLVHFRHHPDSSAEIREGIKVLMGAEPGEDFGLHLFAFGLPALAVGARIGYFKRTKIRRRLPEFLLYLLLEEEKKGCYREKVCAAIWPEVSSEQVLNLFYNALKALKEMFNCAGEGDDVITLEEGYCRLNPRHLHWCDALAFEKLWQRSRQTPDSRDRLKLFLEIINLYRGEFLEEFELEEWGRQQRHRYETLFLRVVELAARQLLAEDRSQEALEVLKKGLAVNYYRERLHRYTLQAYEQLGLDEDKTIHCQKAVQIFSEAFDFEPDFIKAHV